tara:strand:+ start:178 stop:609 length:432 start_codon:yes stop_codon:yes gene_type:complete
MNIFNITQGKMVHKNDKWNISDKRGEEIAHRYIIDILKDSKNNTIPLSELVSLLNHQTKHIKFTNHNKKKPISLYLQCKYGSIVNFLDKYTIYAQIKKKIKEKDIMYVKLMDSEITYNKSIDQNILHEYKDWILIDEEEFILV